MNLRKKKEQSGKGVGGVRVIGNIVPVLVLSWMVMCFTKMNT